MTIQVWRVLPSIIPVGTTWLHWIISVSSSLASAAPCRRAIDAPRVWETALIVCTAGARSSPTTAMESTASTRVNALR